MQIPMNTKHFVKSVVIVIASLFLPYAFSFKVEISNCLPSGDINRIKNLMKIHIQEDSNSESFRNLNNYRK